ncbi:MAG TPA: nucleoside-diphosphate sugar epimerase/dehydratase [Terriglobales bacterium]|nr:nucleoside-diphosphate sugar epimerase/dehydratase [Terriglobales bacterium]
MSRPEREAASYIQRVMELLPSGFFSRTTQFLFDAIACAISLYLAYQLRFDSAVPPMHRMVMWAWMLLLPVMRPALMWALGGYDRIWRYFNLHDGLVLAVTSLPPTMFMALVRFGLWRSLWMAQVPVGVIVIEYLLFVGVAGTVRSLRRMSFEAALGSGPRLRALIVGTEGSLPAALRHISSHHEISVVGLLAPDAKLHGLRIGGFWVLGEPAVLGRLLTSGAVDLVLIADAGLDSIGDLVATATEFGVDVRLLPSAENVMKGDVRVSTSPRPEDVLQDRAVLAEPHPNVVEAFRSRVVLITGAGGSIGSELARQVAGLPVASIILLDRDENSIFEVNRELAGRADLKAQVFQRVGDVRDRVQLQRLFELYRPHIVLHAAAYKHVPVMEENCCEAVLNNVFGTRELAENAVAYHAERFLMISTDKAVAPTSVMGASKRIAELLVQSQAAQIGRRRGDTRMACVRFGNVVGSRGSVVPIFLRQIAAGEPLTITDPEMTRYFMTIPEAVQLVLQAATLGSKGEIYMLDMGDPMKITALARKLVEMSGLRPDKDVEIRFVGARPGEKLEEKLWSEEAQVSATAFPRVMSIDALGIPAGFEEGLERLEAAASAHDESSVRALLESMPIGFRKPAKAAAESAN